MAGFAIKHQTSQGRRGAARIVSAMEFDDLPRCVPGGDRAARQAIRGVAYHAERAEKEWRDKRCYHAMTQLTITYHRMRGIGCYTAGLSKEKQRRLAKRWRRAAKQVSQLHWKMMGSCLRDEPIWTGNEIVYAAAGRPTLSGTLDKAAPYDMRRVIQIAKKQGWRVDRTRKNHYRLCPPTPEEACVITSGTPGTQGSIRKAIAQLRRSGLDI